MEKEKREQYFRNVGALNLIFLVSSIVMFITIVWAIWADWDREYKKYQREFFALEEVKAEQQLNSTWTDEQKNALAQLETDLHNAQAQLAQHQTKANELEDAFKKEDVKYYDHQQRMNFAKAEYESLRYDFEVARQEGEHGGDQHHADVMQAKMEAKLKEYTERAETFKTTERVWTEAKRNLDEFRQAVTATEKKIAALTRDRDTITKKIEQSDLSEPVNRVRHIPLLDFVNPLLRVRQISVSDLYDDLNFLQVPKIDACTTCHMGIEKAQAYATDKQPFRAHPRPELFVTSASPHPMDKFGCSICHYGGNQATTFVGSYHSPRNDAQREEWVKNYHWHPLHDWDYPQLTAELYEASCFKCHARRVEVPGASKLNRGKEIVERYGCFGCHKIEAFDGYQRVGPDLYHITQKTTEEWILKWVKEPKSFRPTTRMPQFFNLANTRDDKDWAGTGMKWQARSHAEIEAMVAFLTSKVKEPIELQKYPGSGDAARGKQVFGGQGGVGCLACHAMTDDFPTATPNNHGPELSGVGSKVNADWLFTWVKNPRHYRPDTAMPNLRLTDEEATDVTAYLLTKKNAEFEAATFERAPEKAFEQIWLDVLTDKMARDEAERTVAAMDRKQRKIDLGKRLVERYGCFGCHKIDGYEAANPIGTELSGSQAWGSKDVEKLDFGLLHSLPHTRNAWFQQKIADTRIFDEGRVKLPLELLKMPKFNFTPEQISDLAVFIQSLVVDRIVPEVAEQLTPPQQKVEAGRKLVKHYNCRGCHEVENLGGNIRQHVVAWLDPNGNEDPGENEKHYPPTLNGEGFKTQPEWLFGFLKAPTKLRQGIKVRMPTFAFTDEEANTLVSYFNHQELWQNAADRDLWLKKVEDYGVKNPAYTVDAIDALDTPAQKAEQLQLRDLAVKNLYRGQGGKFLFDVQWPYRGAWVDELKGTDLADAQRLVVNAECLKCHPTDAHTKTTMDLAPSLSLTAQRLRPDWTLLWLHAPGALQPGVAMPQFFTQDNNGTWFSPLATDAAKKEGKFVAGDGERHMRLLRDYLFSKDFQQNPPSINN
ncbi:MAG: c-type cytochrome [Planctomycetota bacterium]